MSTSLPSARNSSGLLAMFLSWVLGLAMWGPATALAQHTTALCPAQTATVTSGGTVSIDISACELRAPNGAGIGGLGRIDGGSSGPSNIEDHGIASTRRSVPGDPRSAWILDYTHNGTSGIGSTDVFELTEGSPTGNGDIRFTITINASASPITVLPASLPTLTAGVPFSQTLTASGGLSPYTYQVQAGSLPPGLNLTTGGVLSGTPTQRGSYSFSVRARDATTPTAQFVDKSYGGTVQNPSLSITPTNATAIQNVAFSRAITVNGGVGPYTCQLETGSFPSGISITTATGPTGCVIGGTTNAAPGNFPVSIRVTDSSTGIGVYFEVENFTVNVSPPPSVSIAVTPAALDEDGVPNFTYTVTRSLNLASPTLVNLSLGGTATNGTDYLGAPATINIPAGAMTATFNIDPVADTVVEPDETVTFVVSAGTGYIVGATPSATGTIRNDDFPSATISVAPAAVPEDGVANLVYTVTLNPAPLVATNVNYTISGTASNGTDYTTISSPVAITAGNPTGTITVNPTADGVNEPDETVTLTLASGSGYVVGTTNSATGTIQNDDDPCALFSFPYTLAGADNTARVANLRQAIQCANANGTADVIDLNAQTVTLSDSFANYTGATGLPEVSTTLTVRNGTLTRSGATEFRIWFVSTAGNLTLETVVVTNGVGQAPGAVGGGGAVYTLGALNVVGSRFSSNSSLLHGGAVHVAGGAINARSTIFSGNFTNIAGGGVGGAIANTGGIVTLTNVLISGNRAVQGGGIYNNNAGVVTLNNTTIGGNATNDQGGGLRNENTVGSVVLNNSVIASNESSLFPLTANVGGPFTSSFSAVNANQVFIAPLDASETAPTTLGDYRLGNLSPAVDAGSNSNAAALTVDLDGNPRRYDDTVVGDTGSGTAPIVDMGAYEKQTNSIPPQADLSITKTDGQTTAVPGTPISYTIVASNAGPAFVANATVVDTFPANITGVTWTCTGVDAGSCPGFGSGNINASVILGVGGSVRFTATGTISAAATGTLSNTATVSSAVIDPNPANNSATDTSTLTQQADLAITKTDGQTTDIPGTSITYTIVASNAGPFSVANATVVDTFPANITGVTWTCVGAGGGICPASGSGNINTIVGLPAGGSVTFTASGTISAAASGTLSNTATVVSGVTDPNTANNSATDTTALTALPQLSISDVSASEGNSGTTQFDFTVSLSSPALAGGVSFDIATADGTATAGSDYQSRSLTSQVIAAGSNSYTFSVQVNGDVVQEPNETFIVNVTNVTGATVQDGQGQGTIQNDDTAGITVNPTTGLTTTEAGGTATFTVVLNTQPTANVSIYGADRHRDGCG